MLYESMEAMIGRTPLLEARRLGASLSLHARLLLKLEGMNPGGSAKDRVALSMLNDAEARGLIAPGGTIIEPTSGNTGVGLAAVGTARGYRVIIVMPDSMSIERRRLMAAYGAEVVLTPGSLGMAGCIDKAQALAASIPGSYIPGQFDNPANPAAHMASTGPEIWQECAGQVDIFVAGVGTGGTITGTGRYLKEQNPALRVIAVEPAASPLLSQGQSGPHGLQGIGANFIPAALDRSVIDEILPVTEENAYAACRLLAAKEGVLAGISSGAALHAAIQVAQQEENTGKTVVVILPDSGERYLSTGVFG